MIRLLTFTIIFVLATDLSAQNAGLSDYNYVVVPDRFEFLSGPDQYQLNSMTAFYLDKSGFNVYMASKAPSFDRCEGLYMDVEELNSFFSKKLQVVFRDCNSKEIYRSPEGTSRYKEYDKSYQDALRKAFKSIEMLRVDQKEFAVNGPFDESVANTVRTGALKSSTLDVIKRLPVAETVRYSKGGNTFVLEKTTEGYTLYEENSGPESEMLLHGKIIVMEQVVKFIDVSGNVFDVAFDTSGNLMVTDSASSFSYKRMD